MKRHYTLSGLLLCLMTLFTLNASALRGGDKTPDKNYLCFTANEDNSIVELTKVASGTIITAVIEYSTDGTSWTAVDFSANTTTGTITLSNAGDKVYFRNAKPASEDNYFSMDSNNYFKFIMTGSIAASGNIMSLVDLNCQTTTIPYQGTFYKLFYNCTKLTSAPELPATTLATSCYYYMFYQCGLTSAPELPATTLASQCYYHMFDYCKYLTTAPELPATTLATSCYNYMFKNCYSLNDMKVAFSKFPSSSMTSSWVTSVASAGTFSCPEGLTGTGANKIPTDWTVKNTYDLTISSESGWASMCVNLPLIVPTGVDVYYASAASGSTIELTQIEAGTVMAPRTAVIVKGTGTVGFPIVAAAGTSYPTNLFQGSSVAKACNAGENYVLNASKSSDDNVHFSIYTGTTLSGHKAWLPMSAVSGASSIQFRFADATAISSVETEVAEDVIYNLAGQRVGSDYRGIVIKNGKKTWNN